MSITSYLRFFLRRMSHSNNLKYDGKKDYSVRLNQSLKFIKNSKVFKFCALLFIVFLTWRMSQMTYLRSNIKIEDFNPFDPNLSDDDPMLIEYIRKFHLEPPSKLPYRLSVRRDPSELSEEMINYIWSWIVKNKLKNGFFIESGAADGEFYSNTLLLEKRFNWTGLLVETNPSLIKRLRSRHRKCWISNVCLSSKPEQLEFFFGNYDSNIGVGELNIVTKKLEKLIVGDKGETLIKGAGTEKIPKIGGYQGLVNCFTLNSVLNAVNVTIVDFFSLDVQGHEFKILEAFNFKKILIKALVIEHNMIPEGKPALDKLMELNGYRIRHEDENDVLYIHNSQII